MNKLTLSFIFHSLLFISFFSHADECFELNSVGKEAINVCRQDLEKLPRFSFKTATIYTPAEIFEGVKVKDLIKHYNITGDTARAYAWDDYSYSIPVAEMIKYDVMLAYKRNGVEMSLENLGPFAIVYPSDLYPDLNTLDANAKTVFQLKQLEVK
ncbi:TPA: molybdopterin-dependent oxidoreductase [Enterobacter asburiae]